jgi:PAS domain S-box-containing protein
MIHSSPEHRHLFGLAPDQVEIPSLEEFFQRIHPDDLGPTAEDLDNAISAGRNVEAHFRIVLPEGTTRYMYGIGRPLVNPSGDIDEFVGAVTDITAAKQAEEALRRSESYLAEAQRLTHTGSGAWSVPGWDALYLSDEWYRIYGFDPKQGLAAWNDRLQRMHPEDQAKVQEAKDRATSEKSDYEVDHRIVLPGWHCQIHPHGRPSGFERIWGCGAIRVYHDGRHRSKRGEGQDPGKRRRTSTDPGFRAAACWGPGA